MNIIFYDLETNGLDYETTSIMQICIIDDKKNVLINEYAHPFDGRIEASEIHGITMDTLINNNAKNKCCPVHIYKINSSRKIFTRKGLLDCL